jgi:EAL domain-containing protein (putative c-di-GMP-specific phosphodiesterase class I)/DNA-binding response OmpR family regulator
MEAIHNNILVLDPGHCGESILSEILSKHGFNVHICCNEADAIAVIDSFKPDIILCRASRKMIKNGTMMCGMNDVAAGREIPFAVVSSGTDVDFYLKGLEHGLAHTITAPFSGEFLVSRILEILAEKSPVAEEAPVTINIPHDGSNRSLSVPPSHLSRFILSLLRDSVSHAGALSELLQKRNDLHQRICRPDVFEGVRSKTEEELQFERDLYDALDRNEFSLQYQPIVSFVDDRIIGFEALLRWNHPTRGVVMPADFIPVAERNPVIIPLGFWIIEEAVRQLAAWQRLGAANRSLHVGINLSANQFIHPDLGPSILRILKKHRIVPETIVFEITESAFMTNMQSANLQLLSLKSNKHQILLDDFGTGYSSLSYLQHFPVDTLKIDRSFVRWMHMDDQSEHIVKTIVGLAHNLGLKVIAEGVEEDAHRLMLRSMECDFGQGYLFSPPLDADAALEFIRNA